MLREQQAVDERWAQALRRAIDDGLDVLVEPASGQAFVESASTPGRLYAVSAGSCTCTAGTHGLPCKHVACYRAQVGLLSLSTDDTCFWCDGRGTVEDVLNERYQPCDACSGTGRKPERRLTGLPSVMPTAAAA